MIFHLIVECTRNDIYTNKKLRNRTMTHKLWVIFKDFEWDHDKKWQILSRPWKYKPLGRIRSKGQFYREHPNHNIEIFLSFALYFPYKFWQRCWQSFSVSHSFMSIHVRSSFSCCQNLYSDWLSFNQSDQIIIFWHFSFIKFKSFSTTTLITAKSIRAGVMTCSTMGSALINIITFKRDLIIFCPGLATAIIWTSCIDACCIFGTYWTACAFVYILVALILRVVQTKSILFL